MQSLIIVTLCSVKSFHLPGDYYLGKFFFSSFLPSIRLILIMFSVVVVVVVSPRAYLPSSPPTLVSFLLVVSINEKKKIDKISQTRIKRKNGISIPTYQSPNFIRYK